MLLSLSVSSCIPKSISLYTIYCIVFIYTYCNNWPHKICRHDCFCYNNIYILICMYVCNVHMECPWMEFTNINFFIFNILLINVSAYYSTITSIF